MATREETKILENLNKKYSNLSDQLEQQYRDYVPVQPIDSVNFLKEFIICNHVNSADAVIDSNPFLSSSKQKYFILFLSK